MVPVLTKSLGKIFYETLKSRNPNDTIIVSANTNEEISNGKILEASVNLAKYLQNHAIQKGDIVAIVSINSWEYLALVIACFYTGATAYLLNYHYTSGELSHLFNICSPNIIFCSSDNLATISKVNTNSTRTVTINHNERSDEIDSVQDLLRSSLNPANFTPYDANKKDVAFVITSSGTTGFPKAVQLTQANIKSVFRVALQDDENQLVTFNSSTCTINYLPFFHIMGIVWSLCSLLFDTKSIIMAKFLPELFLQTIEKHKVNNVFAVPPVVAFLTQNPLVVNYDLSSLNEILCSAAPVDPTVEERLKTTFKSAIFRQMYGMSEMCGPVTADMECKKQGCVGRPISTVTIKVVDEEGREVGANVVGEFLLKGDGLMKGYHNNIEETRASFDADGFLKSGDLGYCDKDGDFFIVGRSKEVIKCKGFQVPPAELENILNKHELIEDCAVVGIPNERVGEAPLAFVVKAKGAEICEAEIVQYVKENVSIQKQLYGGVRFIEEIPKNINGKILRQKLKELAGVKN